MLLNLRIPKPSQAQSLTTVSSSRFPVVSPHCLSLFFERESRAGRSWDEISRLAGGNGDGSNIHYSISEDTLDDTESVS